MAFPNLEEKEEDLQEKALQLGATPEEVQLISEEPSEVRGPEALTPEKEEELLNDPVVTGESQEPAEEIPEPAGEETPKTPEDLPEPDPRMDDIDADTRGVIPVVSSDSSDYDRIMEMMDSVVGTEGPETVPEPVSSYEEAMASIDSAVYNLPQTQEEADQVEIEDVQKQKLPWNDIKYVMRQGGKGVTNVLDLPTDILDIASTIDGVAYSPVKGDKTADLLMYLDSMSPVQALAKVLMLKKDMSSLPTTAGDLYDSLVAEVYPETAMGSATGLLLEGATEGAILAAGVIKYARGADMDKVPEFAKDILKEAAEDPKKFLSQEGWSGAFAVLGGAKAQEWYQEAYDDPELAPLAQLVGSFLGASIRDPFAPIVGTAKVVKNTAGSWYGLGKSLVQSFWRGARGVTQSAGESVPAIGEFLDKNFVARAFGMLGDKIAPPKTEKEVLDVLDEVRGSEHLQVFVEQISKALNISGLDTFDADVARAKALKDLMDLELTTGNVSATGAARGMTTDLQKQDPNEALGVFRTNERKVKEFFENAFQTGDPKVLDAVEDLTQEAYRSYVEAAIETQRNLELALDNIHMTRATDVDANATKFRNNLKVLEEMSNDIKNSLYRVDPTHKIKLPADAFESIGTSPDFLNPDVSGVTTILRRVYGTALAATLKRKLTSGRLSENTKITEDLLKRLKNGEVEAILQVPKNSRQIFYTDADEMIKRLRREASDALDNTAGGGGLAKSLRDYANRTNDDLFSAMRDKGFHVEARQRQFADDFYREFINGNFDPGNTYAGKLLEQKKPMHFSIQNHRALDSIFENPTEVRRFLSITDPEKSGEILTNIKATRFGDFVEEKAIPLDSEEVFKTLRESMAAHIHHRYTEHMLLSPDDPRTALRIWSKKHKESLDQFPEVSAEINRLLSDPNLDSPGFAEARKAAWLAKQDQDRLQLANLFGKGALGNNALKALEDDRSARFLADTFAAKDPSGELRAAFLNEAISKALKVTDNGVLDPKKVEEFIERYGRGVERIGGKHTIKTLQDYAAGAEIVKRSAVGQYAVDMGSDVTESWLLDNAGKMWTNMRQHLVMNVNPAFLWITQAAQEGTKALKKMDAESQESLARVYTAILSDPEVAQRLIKASSEWQKAGSVAARANAEDEIRMIFAWIGAPVTAHGVTASEIAEDLEDLEEPEEPETTTEELIVVDEDGSETEVTLEETPDA